MSAHPEWVASLSPIQIAVLITNQVQGNFPMLTPQ